MCVALGGAPAGGFGGSRPGGRLLRGPCSQELEVGVCPVQRSRGARSRVRPMGGPPSLEDAVGAGGQGGVRHSPSMQGPSAWEAGPQLPGGAEVPGGGGGHSPALSEAAESGEQLPGTGGTPLRTPRAGREGVNSPPPRGRKLCSLLSRGSEDALALLPWVLKQLPVLGSESLVPTKWRGLWVIPITAPWPLRQSFLL